MTALYKIVDGVQVPLTEAETAAFNASATTWASGVTSRTAKLSINNLEASITPRRLREAVLGIDGGWLSNINTQIAALRTQL